MSEWSKTPPVEPGWYWVRYKEGTPIPVLLEPSNVTGEVTGNWRINGASWSSMYLAAHSYEFGQRIPTNAELFAASRSVVSVDNSDAHNAWCDELKAEVEFQSLADLIERLKD